MKKVRGLMAGLFILGVMAACGESTIENVDKEESAAAATETDTEAVEEEAAETEDVAEEEVVEEEGLGIGDTVNFNGLHVTVNEVRKYEGDGDWETPDNDYFLILDVSIENTTDEAANISTLMQMSLMDPSGYSQDMDIFVDTRGSLDGEVGAGRTMAGEISFDVEDADFFEFIFEDPFMSGQAIWEMDSSDWN
ncbi:DUF4352 domain-containing protein [Bacillus sp. H-16]|uniref:DUF4352 domain-containing protein n=1 Tax=Alteribacter salitolerans TaxID=2912333 RepID=UPI001966870A|nr:DUF4352 domain-containing protein [Alteribacter salitolerans]MBM7095031.1 DUF4352 domain-containing protein [Alteribacter salitolerans]